MGAHLIGPHLLNSFERFFVGPITVIRSSQTMQQSPVTWLDVVTYARSLPAKFVLAEEDGVKTCRFSIKGGQVEISENDFALITNRRPESMVPREPLDDDEYAELATIDILEGRVAALIKKADAVASKARFFNHQLKNRKHAINAHQTVKQGAGDPDVAKNKVARLQTELLEQYLSHDHREALRHVRPMANGSVNGQHAAARGASVSSTASNDPFRAIMASKMENLNAGDDIHPPCDRCRRLGYDCKKHLTACRPCTTKHARCSWKSVTESELGAQSPSQLGSFQTAAMNGQQATGSQPSMAPGFVVQPGFVTPQRQPSLESDRVSSESSLFVSRHPRPREEARQRLTSEFGGDGSHAEVRHFSAQDAGLFADAAMAVSATRKK